MARLKEVEIYTDGACSGNPGPGGYGAILLYGRFRRETSGGYRMTTNNRMELLGAIAALRLLKEPCKVLLFSDSSYLVNAVGKNWLKGWKARNWVKADKEPVLNRDLWQQLDELLTVHQVTFKWVKGHADNANNNRCDELARAATANKRKWLEDTGFSGK